MEDNIENRKVIDIADYVRNIEAKLYDVLKNASYAQLTKYIEELPMKHQDEESLYYWGVSYRNEYFKIIGRLDRICTPENEVLKYKIYILYLREAPGRVVFTFDEFITFSRLVNVAFSDYNPNKTRKSDKEPYQSGNAIVDSIINQIARNAVHSPDPNAYEVTHPRLKILLGVLNEKKRVLLDEEFSKIDLDDAALTDILSEKRIQELKMKKDWFW